MSERQLPNRNGCVDPPLNESLSAYCFGDLGEKDTEAFEIHLLECTFCWEQLQELRPAVSVLRSLVEHQGRVERITMAGQIRRPFGGHIPHVFASSTIYSALFALALFVEVAYDWQHFSRLSAVLAPLIFSWVFLSTSVALWSDWILTTRGRSSGFVTAASVLAFSSATVFVAILFVLPSSPTVEASFQTFPAQAAYLKSVLYFLFAILIFWLPPFHFVLSMQRELQMGHHREVLSLLTNDPLATPPAGVIFPRFPLLRGLWILTVMVGLGMTFYLFNNLKPNPNLNLFMTLVELRVVLYFVFGTEALIWYYRALNSIKRECVSTLAGFSQNELQP